MTLEGQEEAMDRTPHGTAVDITALPDDMFAVVLHGDDVTGELFAAADRDAIGADTAVLASAQSTISGRDELNRLRGRIGELLGEALGAEALDDPYIAGLIAGLKRAITRHAGASDDEARTLNVLVEVAAERARQREQRTCDHDDQMSDADWRELHVADLLRAFPKRRGCDKLAGREHLVQAMATLAAHIQSIDRRDTNESESWATPMPLMTDIREVRPIKGGSGRTCEFCSIFKFADFEVLSHCNIRGQAEHFLLDEKTIYSCEWHLGQAVRNNPFDEQAATEWLLLRPGRLPSGEEVWTVLRASDSHELMYGYIRPADKRPGKPDFLVPWVSAAELETLRLAWARARCGEMDISERYRIIGDQIETLPE